MVTFFPVEKKKIMLMVDTGVLLVDIVAIECRFIIHVVFAVLFIHTSYFYFSLLQ